MWSPGAEAPGYRTWPRRGRETGGRRGEGEGPGLQARATGGEKVTGFSWFESPPANIGLGRLSMNRGRAASGHAMLALRWFARLSPLLAGCVTATGCGIFVKVSFGSWLADRHWGGICCRNGAVGDRGRGAICDGLSLEDAGLAVVPFAGGGGGKRRQSLLRDRAYPATLPASRHTSALLHGSRKASLDEQRSIAEL